MENLITIRQPPASRDRFDGHAVRLGGKSGRQVDCPAALGFIHAQHQTGGHGRVVQRLIHEKKIFAHLQDRQGKAVDQQPHGYAGGMSPAIRRRDE